MICRCWKTYFYNYPAVDSLVMDYVEIASGNSEAKVAREWRECQCAAAVQSHEMPCEF